MRKTSAVGLLVLLTLAGCSSSSSQAPPDGTAEVSGPEEITSDPGRARPELVTNCDECHTLDALAAKGAVPDWRQHAAEAGEGLLRTDGAIPDGRDRLAFPWPRRGGHPDWARTVGACATCHPVDDNGIGHGLRVYDKASAATVFAGGQGCGAACHSWLPSEGTATSLDGSITWSGSFQAEDLLAAGTNAHTMLWQEGRIPLELPTRIAHFNPGCGGCHNVAEESHGATQSCLDCHVLGGSAGQASHDKMVAAITAHRETFDPDGPETACAYCHFDEDFPERGRAACYNCHLTGHQPLGSDGLPQLWPGAAPE